MESESSYSVAPTPQPVVGDMKFKPMAMLDYLTDCDKPEEVIPDNWVDVKTVRQPYPLPSDLLAQISKMAGATVKYQYWKPRSNIDSIFVKLYRNKYQELFEGGAIDITLQNHTNQDAKAVLFYEIDS